MVNGSNGQWVKRSMGQMVNGSNGQHEILCTNGANLAYLSIFSLLPYFTCYFFELSMFRIFIIRNISLEIIIFMFQNFFLISNYFI